MNDVLGISGPTKIVFFCFFCQHFLMRSKLNLVLFISGQSKADASAPKKQESIEEIFTELNSKPTTSARRLALLNAFVKLINLPIKDDINSYNTEELLIR